MRFTLDGQPPEFGDVAGSLKLAKARIDIEAVTGDRTTGLLWFAYEGRNLIERRTASLGEPVLVKPEPMAQWGVNSGAEAMVRLADGRFLILAEGPNATFSPHHAALLFSCDPVLDPAVTEFSFAPPSGYRPVDLAQLPDGRVLILVRKFIPALPPRFETMLVVADPGDIVSDTVWSGRPVASFAPPIPSDNYEGMDVVARPDGSTDIWLIADDNLATLQRTLLLRLLWQPDGAAAAPR